MYKVSVTTLEKFRRYINEVVPTYDTEEALIESLKGIFEGNDKTRFGSAFHKIIEEPRLYQEADVIVEDEGKKILVPFNVAKMAHAYAIAHPLMVCEVPVKKVYQVGLHKILVTGRLDGLEGCELRDTKTKYRAASATEYMDSYQWRFYADMTGSSTFHYDIFEIKYFGGLQESEGGVLEPVITRGRDKQPRPLGIIYHEPITCRSYLGMQTDCERLLSDFMDYIDNRNFYHLLKTVSDEAIVL